MTQLAGKVALITGAARGQGRSHALHFARAGADLALADICADLPGLTYPLATPADLDETVRQVEAATGRRALARICDVRSGPQVEALVAAALAEFGRLDIVINNAGIGGPVAPAWELDEAAWQTMLDINLTGVWRVCRAVAPAMIARRAGRIINIASVGGLKGLGLLSHYSAAKHGVIGLTRSLAIELAPHNVTVNAVCPGSVDTPLLEAQGRLYGLDPEAARRTFAGYHLFPALLDPADISQACLWLASDAARYVTGLALPVDAGMITK